MTEARRKFFTAAQWLFGAAVVWYALAALRGQWDEAAARLGDIDIEWRWLFAASAIVLLTYLLLIDTWRKLVVSAGDRLSFRSASRIWFVSNLGKYIPGKVWSVGAMAVMSKEQGVSGVTAAGSSIVVQLITVVAGIGVVLVTGAQTLERPGVALTMACLMAIALASLPHFAARLPGIIRVVTGRTVGAPSITGRAVAEATVKAVVAWTAYGIAFQLFVRGIAGEATGATLSYIAVYAASYIIGFLALFAPGGAVVRESAMIAGMLRLGLAGQADAVVVAITSRIWLTVTELLPGLVYLALGKPNPGHDPKT